jgi:hypothetical protein|tara:strand:- start:273 stop:554 length:282 start_codon:yes stop_codon:yes gene_type:complete
MDIDTVIRLAAVGLAASLLLSAVDVSVVFSKVKGVFKWPFKKREVVVVEPDPEVKFLHIVDLWHKLKISCDEQGLNEATEKLDEVFPLLNSEG